MSSHYVEDAAALLDPMVPDEGLPAFDALVPPERVVLSCRHHNRDHAQFVQAFGASFHVHEAGVHEYEGEEVQPYAIGQEVAPGIRAVANGPIAADDTVLHIDVEGGAVLFADSLLNSDIGLGFMPDSLLGDDPEQVRRDITRALGELLDERFEHLLFAHGDPIVGDGYLALRRFVDKQQSAR